jgi:serine/threonine protein kinase/tetratricopeptide (TPR) repeat protein
MTETDASGTHSPGALSALLARLARGPPVSRDEVWAVPLRAGDRVGRYEVVRELARGGFGAVYEAIDREIGRAVAVKTVRPGRALSADGGADWLHAEAEAIGSLSHPGIVGVYDVGAEDGAPYVVMELLRGETLAHRLARRPLTAVEAVRIARDVAAALAYAHGRGVLHRDLQPCNVFLCEDGTTKLLDFGLSHVFGHAGWHAAGTPAYLAPERWKHDPEDARGDLFSLGVLLYEMLAGKVPYPATEHHGAALDPGPPPRLAVNGLPRRLHALVASALAKDRAGRPPSADVVLAELVAIQRRLDRRQRSLRTIRIAALVIAVAAAVSGVLWRERQGAAPASERLSVSVADIANETGDRELDGLSGLVITSLEQSRHLSVLTRSRMADLLRQVGREDAPSIDEALARTLAERAGASAVLVGSIRRFEDTYMLELRGLDPKADSYLFAVREEGRGKASIPAAVDRLSARAREALRERSEDVRSSAIRVAEAVTPNLEAYQHYFEGVDCLQRPSRHPHHPDGCVAELRRAVAVDPTFALAWLQLAMVGWDELSPVKDDAARAIREALKYADRVPEKERALIRAWAAVLDGRTGEAIAELEAVLRAFPTDKQALYLAGDLLWHREELDAAIPYLERVLALDPTFDYALDHVAYAHAVLGHGQALSEWKGRWEAMPPSAPVLRAIVGAHLGLGDGDGAVAAARRALAIGPEDFALFGLGHALTYTGAYAELERTLRPRAGSPDFLSEVLYAHALAAQGRRAAARQVLDGIVRRGDEEAARDGAFVRAVHVAGEGDAAALHGEIDRLRARDPDRAARLAPHVARLGDLAYARELAEGLAPGTPMRALYEAILAWKDGRIDDARARLDALEREHPSPMFGFPPAFVRAELELENGRDAEALAAIDRYDRVPFQRFSRSWAYPQSLLLRGRALARLGRDDEARATLERLLKLWVNADPGLPLLDETRQLLSQLRSDGQ